VFGACSSEHGHNYVVEVTLEGDVDPDTGMIANLKDVDAVLKRELISAVDHRHLNRDVDFLRGVVPTAENIALEAWKLLGRHFEPARLVRLRVVESENNSAEVVAE
jgi:6-pyruvoyltetrahydropterin/6-carboxytetrahydropterin synthase